MRTSAGKGGRGAVAAIVAAGGEGRRAGLRVPKQFLKVGGRTLLEHAVSRLAAHPSVDFVVAVVPAGRLRQTRRLLSGRPKIAAIVPGGVRRQDSVEAGLAAVDARGASIVLVHDAARPLVPAAVIGAVIREARRSGAAVPGVPPVDTVKLLGPDGKIERTLPREDLRMIQTPQGFKSAWLRQAFVRAAARRSEATDDASLVEAAGRRVAVVPGSPENFKVTTAEDVARIRGLLRRRPRGLR
jgi:2-C-methyl-D-erythritol 4-phosphate cytidylyltransferase